MVRSGPDPSRAQIPPETGATGAISTAAHQAEKLYWVKSTAGVGNPDDNPDIYRDNLSGRTMTLAQSGRSLMLTQMGHDVNVSFEKTSKRNFSHGSDKPV